MIGPIHGGEIVLLIFAALIILGPSRLPEYAAKLGQGVRYLRDLAEGAKGQIKEELGPGFEDIDWRQLDPRQYDPRRIVKDALSAPPSAPSTPPRAQSGARPPVIDQHSGPALRAFGRAATHDPSLPTPFDVDAT